jgi:GH25 family lysozyme M1 (1,4-beta-N-acetylmuramidase)
MGTENMTDLCFVADMGSQNPVDLSKLKNAAWNGSKCEGTILRATRSNCLVDRLFAARVEAAAKLDFLVGGYAFNTGETAAVQAARYLGAVRPLLDVVKLHALDFETNPSGRQMSLPSCVEYLDRLAQAIGRRPWLYSGDRIKSLVVTATAAERQALSEVIYWGCEYGEKFRNLDDDGHQLPWDNGPSLWQRTGDGIGPEPHTLDGLQAGADLSIFNGTREQLAAVWPGAAIAA